MIQIKIGRSEDWANIALRGLWEQGHCVRDIRICQAQNDHYPTIMIIYEDYSEDSQKNIRKMCEIVQEFQDKYGINDAPNSTSGKHRDLEEGYSIYLNG